MITLAPYRPELAPELLAVWHAAFGDRYPIMPALWEAHTSGDPSFRDQDGIVALSGNAPVGFAFAKRFREDFPGCERFRSIGYLSLLAVHPDYQRQGIGTHLLGTAEVQLQRQGATKVVLGGSFHHVLPGIPATASEAMPFFEGRGYALGKEVWDVRRNLSALPALPDVGDLPEGITLRPYLPGEEPVLVDFLNGEFPGRWARDVALQLKRGGAIAHVFGLFQAGIPVGFALLHPPRSEGALRWAGFNPEIAALGPIGVGKAVRGQGLGLALLVRALERLRALGAEDTVIDWTDLLEFYARCGFQPWLSYRLAQRDM